MSDPHWKNLKEIFDAALALPSAARAAYLDEVCDGNDSLRAAVESHLKSHEETGNLVDKPAYKAAAEMLVDSVELKAGQTVGHYKILSLLGEGGMGTVYLAEDTKLHRRVCLKFISTSFTEDCERLRRFEQEARAASALNHPNILTIHEIGEEDGRQFIATEFIEGQTLRERLRSGFEIEDALETAIQVASALVAAHRVNVVHRDIKPENIMIRRDDGLVKVLDFGLAKISPRKPSGPAADSEIATALMGNTAPGVVMGTVAYMSPEQARGDNIDERTDIWSLGVVLYEMVAGCSPFMAGTSNEIISAILAKTRVPPLARYVHDVPPRLTEIIDKSLTKDRDERYQTSKDLLIDLRRLKQSLADSARLETGSAPDVNTGAGGKLVVEDSSAVSSVANKIHSPSSAEYIVNQVKSHKRGVLVALAVLVLSAASLLYFRQARSTTHITGVPEIRSLAVLPLNNLSGDPAQEYFADGMTEALISNLSQIRALKVTCRQSAMRFKGSTKSLPEIADELHVDAVVEGSVQRSGGRVHVTARLIPAAADSPLWSQDYDRDLSDVLKLQSEVARAVTDEIRIQVTPDESARLGSARSVDPQAHEAYLLGRYHLRNLNDADLTLAIKHFERAITITPDFAVAYAGLADAWRERGIWGAKSFKECEAPAHSAALRAVQLDTKLAETHTALGMVKFVYDWDWAGANNELKIACDLDRGNSDVHANYAYFLMALGRHEEAIREMQTAQQLDPLSSQIESGFGRVLYRARKYEEAILHLKRALDLEPRNYSAYIRLGDVYAKLGKYDDAISMFEKANQLRSDGMHMARIARVYAMMGRQPEARRLVSGLKTGAFDLAAVYAALGDSDEAFRILEKAVSDRASLLVNVKEDPSYDSLRSDPRWTELLRRMNYSTE